MLKLISWADGEIIFMYTYLNTSHVKVNLSVDCNISPLYLYLNTSHVKVNLSVDCNISPLYLYLNTSHVKVNRTYRRTREFYSNI